MFDGEIVGLQETANGRSCFQHACCEKTIKVGDVVHFQATTVRVANFDEFAVQAVLQGDAGHACVVGFLPKASIARTASRYVNKQAVIVSLVDHSPNSVNKRRISKQNCGMAEFKLL